MIINIPHKSVYTLNNNIFEGKVISYSLKDDYIDFVIKDKEKIKCKYYGSFDIKYGIKLKVYGKLNIPINNTVPNNFNYKKYLNHKNIFYTCNVTKVEVLKEENIFYKVKNNIVDRINTYKDTNDYLFTFILGDKTYLNEEEFSNYQKNGVTHLFAISGMHVGLLSAIILFCLKKVMSDNKRYLTTALFIFFYAFITGFSPSVMRASLLFFLLALNKVFYTEVKTLNILILTFTILVIINPFLLFDLGFIYSFSTTFGLIYKSDYLKKHKILGTSLIASIYSLPITINNFYEFNPFSILLNIIFVPFVSVIVYPLVLITFIVKPLNTILVPVLSILKWLNNVSSLLYKYKIIIPKLKYVFVILYYLILLFYKKPKYHKVLIYLIITLFINSLFYRLDSNLYVEYLDVGQGDSTLIRQKDYAILIDTGGIISYDQKKTYFVSDNTINYLKSKNIKNLEALILTHGDYDHMGEAINLVNNFKVEKVIFNCGPYNDLERDLIKTLDKNKIPYYSCIKELKIDKNKLSFLQTEKYDNENDNSNVIYTELDGYKFMFMGDASSTTEKEILSKYNLPNIDVLKVGHHGSKTSSSIEFIDEINPKYSVISVGKNNRYGHPNKEVLGNLKDSKLYRTDIDGSIMFMIKNKKINIETCSP